MFRLPRDGAFNSFQDATGQNLTRGRRWCYLLSIPFRMLRQRGGDQLLDEASNFQFLLGCYFLRIFPHLLYLLPFNSFQDATVSYGGFDLSSMLHAFNSFQDATMAPGPPAVRTGKALSIPFRMLLIRSCSTLLSSITSFNSFQDATSICTCGYYPESTALSIPFRMLRELGELDGIIRVLFQFLLGCYTRVMMKQYL